MGSAMSRIIARFLSLAVLVPASPAQDRTNEDEVHIRRGIVLASNGNPDQAIREFRRAIRLNSSNPEAHYNLGNVYYEKGNHAEAHVNLGIALYFKGDLDQVIAEFREAIRLQPDFAPAHFNLGKVLEEKGELRAALEAYEKASDLDRNNDGYREGYRKLLGKIRK